MKLKDVKNMIINYEESSKFEKYIDEIKNKEVILFGASNFVI